MITSMIGRTFTTRFQNVDGVYKYVKSVNKETELPLTEGSEYLVTNIDGLGPADGTVNTLDSVLDPGGVEVSAQTGQRNIVATVSFHPDASQNATTENLRKALYAVFSVGNEVQLEFVMDTGESYLIEGWVEKHTPVIFSSDPTVQISIINPDPYFDLKGATTETVTIQNTSGQYDFNVPFDGDVAVGFVVDADVAAAMDSSLGYGFNVTSSRDLTIFIDVAGTDFAVGDHIQISTVKGDRHVTLTQSGSANNGLPFFGGSLVDMQLLPGDNWFQFTQSEEHPDMIPQVTFSFLKRYGGL